MIVLGLTGSIGMGKSTAASQLRALGVPVFDADGTVHQLLGPNGAAVAAVGAAFPHVVFGGAVERTRLAARVFGRDQELKRLEMILHPLVAKAERRFLGQARRRRCPVVALDIPLLFETHGHRRADAVLVVTCPAFLQEQRVMRRPGMTLAKLASIRGYQMPDAEKRARADYVVPTGIGRRVALHHIRAALARLRTKRGGKRR